MNEQGSASSSQAHDIAHFLPAGKNSGLFWSGLPAPLVKGPHVLS